MNHILEHKKIIVLSILRDQVLSDLWRSNPCNLNFSYLNINSVRDILNNFQKVIDKNKDIISTVETTISDSFLSTQFPSEKYPSPGVGLFLYTRNLHFHHVTFPFQIYATLSRPSLLKFIREKQNGW